MTELKANILHVVPEGVDRTIVVQKAMIRSPIEVRRNVAYLADPKNEAVRHCLRKGYLQLVSNMARGKAPYLSLSFVGEPTEEVKEESTEEVVAAPVGETEIPVEESVSKKKTKKKTKKKKKKKKQTEVNDDGG